MYVLIYIFFLFATDSRNKRGCDHVAHHFRTSAQFFWHTSSEEFVGRLLVEEAKPPVLSGIVLQQQEEETTDVVLY